MSDLPSVPPDSSEILNLKHGHKAKVDRSRPENSSKWLAMQLVEAMDQERVHRMQKQSYELNVSSEKQKIQQFKNVIAELKRRKKDPPKTVSRMDPYNTYDLNMCKEELAQAIERMQKFTQEVVNHTIAEKKAQRQQKVLQRRIQEVNAKR